jgi:hypothetical protein
MAQPSRLQPTERDYLSGLRRRLAGQSGGVSEALRVVARAVGRPPPRGREARTSRVPGSSRACATYTGVSCCPHWEGEHPTRRAGALRYSEPLADCTAIHTVRMWGTVVWARVLWGGWGSLPLGAARVSSNKEGRRCSSKRRPSSEGSTRREGNPGRAPSGRPSLSLHQTQAEPWIFRLLSVAVLPNDQQDHDERCDHCPGCEEDGHGSPPDSMVALVVVACIRGCTDRLFS